MLQRHMQHMGDALFATSASIGTATWLSSLDTIMSILVAVIAAIAGIYSIIWNRARLKNERSKDNEKSK